MFFSYIFLHPEVSLFGPFVLRALGFFPFLSSNIGFVNTTSPTISELPARPSVPGLPPLPSFISSPFFFLDSIFSI